MERVIYDHMAEIDDQHWWFVARRQILKAVIERGIGRSRKLEILEIGCGTGHNLRMLSGFGHVEGLELDEQARALARERTDTRVGHVSLPELEGVKRGHYDLIALLDVLEHVDEDRASLSAILDCLKPGGRVLVKVPAHRWLWSVHDEMHHHKRRYSKGELMSALSAAGLESIPSRSSISCCFRWLRRHALLGGYPAKRHRTIKCLHGRSMPF